HRQRCPGLVEDRARRQRGAGTAAAALDPAVAQPPPAGMTTAQAGKTVRPAQPLQVVQAVLIGAEPGKELPSRTRIVRACHRHHEQILVRLNGYPLGRFSREEKWPQSWIVVARTAGMARRLASRSS